MLKVCMLIKQEIEQQLPPEKCFQPFWLTHNHLKTYGRRELKRGSARHKVDVVPHPLLFGSGEFLIWLTRYQRIQVLFGSRETKKYRLSSNNSLTKKVTEFTKNANCSPINTLQKSFLRFVFFAQVHSFLDKCDKQDYRWWPINTQI